MIGSGTRARPDDTFMMTASSRSARNGAKALRIRIDCVQQDRIDAVVLVDDLVQQVPVTITLLPAAWKRYQPVSDT